jgi:hypothetical protein
LQTGVTAETLAKLADDVANETDRLAKRLVRAKGRSLPAGVALLAEDPLRALVVIVEDAQADEPAPVFGVSPNISGEKLSRPNKADPAEDNWHFADRRPPVRQADRDINDIAAAGAAGDAGEPGAKLNADDATANEPVSETAEHHRQDETGEPPNADASAAAIDQVPIEAGALGEWREPVNEWREPVDEPAAQEPPVQADSGPDQPAAADDAGDETGDRPSEDLGAESTSSEDAAAAFATDPNASPVRFVWKTDADGRFSSLSPDLPPRSEHAAADVIGQKFRDVANRFALDPDGEIAGLLERRDTWSGRSVMWPVSGTDLKVPVDLAALPVYGRDRNFEGFRGFGVVRAGDAIVDDDAIGLALASGAKTCATEPNGSQSPSHQKPRRRPVRQGSSGARCRGDAWPAQLRQGDPPGRTPAAARSQPVVDRIERVSRDRRPVARGRQAGAGRCKWQR